MITKAVLGNGTILENIDEVQEVVQNNGNFILNGFTINIIKDNSGTLPDLSVVESLFSSYGALNSIKIYSKDVVETQVNEAGEELKVYGDEYLSLDTSKYTGVQSIYKHISNGIISVQLTTDLTKLSDDRGF